jgi:hypothetical protein
MPCLALRWIEIRVCTEGGQPLEGLRVRMVDPSGTEHDGELDEDGVIGLEDIEPGGCLVSLPDVPDAYYTPARYATAARHEIRLPDWDLVAFDEIRDDEQEAGEPADDQNWDLVAFAPVETNED